VDCSLKALFFNFSECVLFFLSRHFGLVKAKFGAALHKYNMGVACNWED
jgi:hypothetical protein